MSAGEDRLLRTIRMDPSDTFVFEHAAEPGEWAVTGTFIFHGRAVADMPRKMQTAFRAGFVGVGSLGFSTLVVVSEASAAERAEARDILARRLVEAFGAPDIETAGPAAEEEIAFAADLCRGHTVGTLIALHRSEEEGRIRERFRTLKPRADAGRSDPSMRGHEKAFFLVETDDGEDEPEEHVDLVGLMETKR